MHTVAEGGGGETFAPPLQNLCFFLAKKKHLTLIQIMIQMLLYQKVLTSFNCPFNNMHGHGLFFSGPTTKPLIFCFEF